MITFFTVTGRRLDLGHPRPSDINIEDIACGLSKICRYTGQIDMFYSVAQHACLVASLVREPLRFPALNHDNPEAYLGDVSSKLKHAPQMAWFRDLEALWNTVIEEALRFQGLTPEERREIKAADDLAAVFERITLRYRRDFRAEEDIDRALAQNWVTHSTADEMLALTHRLPAFMTAVDCYAARTMFMNAYTRYSATWMNHVTS